MIVQKKRDFLLLKSGRDSLLQTPYAGNLDGAKPYLVSVGGVGNVKVIPAVVLHCMTQVPVLVGCQVPLVELLDVQFGCVFIHHFNNLR